MPVFVVGKHRSGTTWLANVLCAHSSVAGVQHARHFGIHESAFFSHVAGRYGPISERTSYIECVEALAGTDYFRIAGASKEFLYGLRPATYAELFRSVMDRMAHERSASHWVEKTPQHTLLIPEIAAAYPDACFVAIVREAEDVVRSAMGMKARRDPSFRGSWSRRAAFVVRSVLSWRLYNAVLERFGRRSDRICFVAYEDMRRDPEAETRRVCAFLDLPFEPHMLVERFGSNTSFRGDEKREPRMTGGERTLARLVARLAAATPSLVVTRAAALRPRPRPASLPRWYFQLAEEGSGENPAV